MALSSAAMFVGGLSLSSFNIALPAVSADLGATASQSSWILLVNMLASTGLMVAFGKLADLTSRRRIFIGGVIAFTIGSIVGGLAPNATVLIIGRALTGVGSAMMFSTTSALIAANVSRRQIGQAMGAYFACNSAAQLVGPVVGGLFADSIGWRWLMWINLPFCIGIFIAARIKLNREVPGSARSYDVTGAALFIVMMMSFVAMLTTISARGPGSLLVLGCLIAAVAVLPLFIWRERRAADPMVDLSIFGNRLFTATTGTTFLSHVARFGLMILIALVYQSAYGLSSTSASLLVLPVAVGSLIAAPVAGWLETVRGSALVSRLGTLIVLVGIILSATMIWQPRWYVVVAIGAGLAGAGGGMVLTANSSAVTKSIAVERMGVVGSMRVMIQGVGIITGTALALATVTLLLPAEGKGAVYAGHNALLPPQFRQDLLNGVPIAFAVFAVAAVASVLLSSVAYRGYRDDAPPPSETPRVTAVIPDVEPQPVPAAERVSEPGSAARSGRGSRGSGTPAARGSSR